jgi:hypothetical protein
MLEKHEAPAPPDLYQEYRAVLRPYARPVPVEDLSSLARPSAKM